jgi:uncharacterized membrane protein
MITVTLFMKENCSACEQVVRELSELQAVIPHQLAQIDINQDETLKQKFDSIVPIVEIGPYMLRTTITRQELQVALGAARDRREYLEQTDSQFIKRVERGARMSGADRFSLWFSKNYMIAINLLLFVYVGLPFLAPVLMKIGATLPARVIYTVYSPLCHQLTFRSLFLFGEQPYYPRELAHVPNAITYEQISGQQTIDVLAARQFVGNQTVGYKVAFCERDVAIYGALLLFGIIFMISGRRIKTIPWYLWILIGLIPIGIDGVSQLPSLTNIALPAWVPIRESTPFLRILTGGLFGFLTAWYIFPMIEETMRETFQLMTRKAAVIQQTSAKETKNISDGISSK